MLLKKYSGKRGEVRSGYSRGMLTLAIFIIKLMGGKRSAQSFR